MDTLPRRACLDDCFRKHGYTVERTKRIGGQTVRVLGFVPPEPSTHGIVQIPGFAAQESTYLPQLHGLMHEGIAGCVIVPDAAGDRGASMTRAVLNGIANGYLEKFQPGTMTVAGHSLGASKAARAMLELNQTTDTHLRQLILQAPACLGGFSWLWSGVATMSSMVQEAPFMLRPSQSTIVAEAQRYCTTHPQDIISELAQIEANTGASRLRKLMGVYAVRCVGIEHPHDRLINPRASTQTMKSLGIPVVTVEGDVVGHNAQLYGSTVPAFVRALELLEAPVERSLPQAA